MFSYIITTPHEADASRDNLVSIKTVKTDKKPCIQLCILIYLSFSIILMVRMDNVIDSINQYQFQYGGFRCQKCGAKANTCTLMNIETYHWGVVCFCGNFILFARLIDRALLRCICLHRGIALHIPNKTLMLLCVIRFGKWLSSMAEISP